MSEVQGVVEQVGERKTGTIKNGKRKGQPWDKRSVRIEGTWYGGFANKNTKADLDDVEVGFTVKMDVTQKDDYYNFKSFEIISRATASSNSEAPKENNYQFRQTYGFAAGRALTFVALLLDSVEDPVKAGLLPKAEKKQVEAIELLVDKYTNQFAEASWYASLEEEEEDFESKAADAEEDDEYE